MLRDECAASAIKHVLASSMPRCVPASMEEIDLWSIVLYMSIRYVPSAVAVVFCSFELRKHLFVFFFVYM